MNPQLVEKLQKILALSTERGATPGEMEAAMARAKEIAIKHGIDLASLPAREENRSKLALQIDTEKGLKTSTRYKHPYHNWVMKTLEDVFEVKFIIWESRIGSHPYIGQIYVIGETSDVTIACALFPWLESLFPKLFWKAARAGMVSNSFASQNGFYLGLCEGLCQANQRQLAKMPEADRSKWALVVRSKKEQVQEAAAPHLSDAPAKKNRKSYSVHSRQKGKAEGEKIQLNQIKTSNLAALK